MFPRITSPKRRTPGVNKLLDLIGSTYRPQQVPVILDGSVGFDQLFQCYLVVRSKVEKDGGRMVCGWLIAQSNIYYQAQHHAVWAAPDTSNELICITPKLIAQDEIMFVRDDRYVYKDRDIPNYRVSEPISSVVDDLIILQRIKEVMEAQFDYVDDRNQVVPEQFEEHYALLKMWEKEWKDFLSLGGRITSPCFCGHGKAYRECHGLSMKAKGEALLRDHGLHLDWMPS